MMASDTTPRSAVGSAGFQLDAAPLLSRSTVDRSETLRDSPEKASESWTGGRVLLVDPRGRSPFVERGRLAYRPTAEFEDRRDEAVMLGVHGGTGYWALRVEDEGERDGWWDLRSGGGCLDDADAGLFTTAVGLLNWHARAGFCTVCGSRTARFRAGWARVCTGCEREEYPRTDPAVICLVHDGAEHVLLARQPAWPAERYSVLAGFVEAGESLEACVRREVAEEVGVAVTDVRYLGSQPWPFPRSLMLGFAAVADRNAPVRPADGEIEEARWVHRDDVRAALEAGGNAVAGLGLPPGISIAYRMLRGWALGST